MMGLSLLLLSVQSNSLPLPLSVQILTQILLQFQFRDQSPNKHAPDCFFLFLFFINPNICVGLPFFYLVTILYCSDIVWSENLCAHFFCFLPILDREFYFFGFLPIFLLGIFSFSLLFSFLNFYFLGFHAFILFSNCNISLYFIFYAITCNCC